MRVARRFALVVMAALALAGPASAGVLSASVPPAGAALSAPAEQVRLVLDVAVETAFLALEVRGPDGAVVSGATRRDPRDPRVFAAAVRPAGEGLHTVAWRAFARDGHAHSGTLAFTVVASGAGAPPDPPPAAEADPTGPLAVLARLLALVGPIGLLGLVVARAVVIGPAWAAGGIAPPRRASAGASAGVDVRAAAAPGLRRGAGRWWRAWWALAITALAGVLLAPIALLRELGEGPSALATLVGDTRWGTGLVVQAAALALVLAAALALRGRPAAHAPALPSAAALALGLPPTLALVAISATGHAATGADAGLDIAIDALHNLASAAWLGGLAALLALLPAALRGLADPARVRLAAGIVVRFSSLAVSAVAVIALTGVYRALVELSALSDLLDTGYGQALLAKLVLFAVLLGVGADNRFRLHPRLERAALGLDPSDRGAAQRLRVSVRAELALAGALMVAVAVMVSLPPPG